jgi:hypothetical protein
MHIIKYLNLPQISMGCTQASTYIILNKVKTSLESLCQEVTRSLMMEVVLVMDQGRVKANADQRMM